MVLKLQIELTQLNEIEAPHNNNMASKVRKVKNKEIRGARWSLTQLKLFAAVLADDQNEFAFTLESLALKKSANIHVFESINSIRSANIDFRRI
jgi:hypothetical protein